MTAAVQGTDLPLPLVRRGKVRDVYAVDEERLLIVASDRISAFDVVMPRAIPGKGEVLTLITAWWLHRLAAAAPHHMLSVDPDEIAREVPALTDLEGDWARRAMLCRRTEPLPVECVVRGYLAGSAWQEYREHGTLAGEALPGGMEESGRLDAPLFSPATKAEEGHDENITLDHARELIGGDAAEEVRQRSLSLYEEGRAMAARAGILIADTKFEFGRGPDGALLLIDEVLTPDSSRFWPEDAYAPGRGQPSLDKQPVRDWLETLTAGGLWDKRPPGPDLPDEVVEATTRRYRDAFRRLTGVEARDFPLGDPGSVPGPARSGAAGAAPEGR